MRGPARPARAALAAWSAPKTSTGPAPAPSPRRPSRTASRGDPPRRPRGLERGEARAPGGRRARTSACSRSRARRRRGGARRGSRSSSSPSKKTSVASSRWPPVTTTASGPSACSAPGERLRVVAVVGARRSTRASGRFGVITVARGSSSLDDRRAGGVVQQHGAGLGDHHRVEHDRRAGLEQVQRRRAPRARSRPSPSMPIFTASTPMSSATARDLRDDEVSAAPRGCRSTPTVFCAVSAVIAVIPCTPQRRTPSGRPGCRRRRRSPSRRSRAPRVRGAARAHRVCRLRRRKRPLIAASERRAGRGRAPRARRGRRAPRARSEPASRRASAASSARRSTALAACCSQPARPARRRRGGSTSVGRDR